MSRSSKCAVAGVLLLAAAAVSAQSCPAGQTRLNQLQIRAQIAGNTLCAVSGGDRWQEFHQGGTTNTSGALIDYKKGPNDPVDPSTPVGTWSLTDRGSNTLLVHNYGPSATYSWAVCRANGGTYTLVSDQATITSVTVKEGQSGC
ncbi:MULTISPECIES: hypothetical protein [Rubrivivax]|uniref:Secreted protein n=1 Tax=Rubrivivax benzoatilyticus TaxID=316997 RepID=A0ABX0HXR3_9BURK|nr:MULTISPECIES: hypothetical protein [Rubrivivax]EGJ10134.1 hypothetical protein RBXJA2T_07393 [Rubrivivax benzoatilyticus JA2 = ATCC BAA-35]MCC9596362.1 hypothetical protein [Rubrivivax sp. JA1055]MCC9647295.1 hypothetical protein [Rubrivivax sp. JA1029]NHK99393.1 hypothetical protein [Rubrivivax benzoatilyticus]NHL25267.1 hypothetical protein [Rubrivivax benzoatilyticus]